MYTISSNKEYSKKRATKRDQLGYFTSIDHPNKTDSWCRIEWFVNLVTKQMFITKYITLSTNDTTND